MGLVKKVFYGVLLLILCLAIYLYMTLRTHKLDEQFFYKDDHLELKVATYYENLFLHFNGNVYRVQCRSAGTENRVATSTSDKGWHGYLPVFSGLMDLRLRPYHDMDINRLADVARAGYHVTDSGTIIVETYKGLSVTWNGCRSFKQWRRDDLPDGYVMTDLKATEDGRASARVNYDTDRYIVETRDFGKNWTYKQYQNEGSQ